MTRAEEVNYRPGDLATWVNATVTKGPVDEEKRERSLVSANGAEVVLSVGRVVELRVAAENLIYDGTRLELLWSTDHSQEPGSLVLIPGDFNGFVGSQDDSLGDEFRVAGHKNYRRHQDMPEESPDSGEKRKGITTQAIENAVFAFFEGVDTQEPGYQVVGNKLITVFKDEKHEYEKRISAQVVVDGVQRAVVNHSRGHVSFMRLISDPDADGNRAEAIYNKVGTNIGRTALFEVSGLDVVNRRLARTLKEKEAIARRLEIDFIVPRTDADTSNTT